MVTLAEVMAKLSPEERAAVEARAQELVTLHAHRDQLTEDLGSLEDRMQQLRAENTRLRDEVSDLDALRARVAELEADAARYRFLRDRSYCHPRGIDSPREVGIIFEWQQARVDEDGVTIDDAIDAARASASAGGGQ